jgi:hypothetical protein
MSDPFLLESLRTQANHCRSLAAEARRASLEYVDYADDAPVGFRITNGELYHAHLRHAEHWSGQAEGLEKAIDILKGMSK